MSVYVWLNLCCSLCCAVRIGSMLAYTPLDEKSLALLLNYLQDFLKYLMKNSSLFSASDYEVAPPEYHRKAV
ncbi:unnamed protein product [Oncorhynchus mykiss]|uniref:MRG domain-containing protein n=1 Tax=Oncorhynchus mykiss TaxID=8022 RepID=A0A061A6M2_ONCMY|nr:unnamed protein product [Oncorhynchus mykiss]